MLAPRDYAQRKFRCAVRRSSQNSIVMEVAVFIATVLERDLNVTAPEISKITRVSICTRTVSGFTSVNAVRIPLAA
jgi:hypothetical protein